MLSSKNGDSPLHKLFLFSLTSLLYVLDTGFDLRQCALQDGFLAVLGLKVVPEGALGVVRVLAWRGHADRVCLSGLLCSHLEGSVLQRLCLFQLAFACEKDRVRWVRVARAELVLLFEAVVPYS